jgi:CubicO group peptidase (beta-lactamase class C family)
MKRIYPIEAFILLILLVTSCNGIKKEVPWVSYSSPEEMGFSADSLKKIDLLIQKLTNEGMIPGAVALVAKDGKVFYQTSYGFQDIDSKKPLDLTDIFRIASMTKPITTVAIMQLYEKGKLKLTDQVSEFIPSFANPAVIETFNGKDSTWTSKPASREVTIHDLLTHTSGVTYGFSDPRFSAIYAKNGIPDLAVAFNLRIENTMSVMGKMPLAHDPGAKFTYGLSIDVLGRVVEVVSGMSLADYVQENITGPLKMTDTKYFYDSTYTDRLTTAYSMNPKDTTLVRIGNMGRFNGNYPVEGAKSYYSGGSGMSSTPKDYFIFCQTLMNGGIYNNVRILHDSTVALMNTDNLGSLRWSETSTFGYGFRINRVKNADGTQGPIFDLGWGGAFSTWFTINPTDKVIEVIMTQVLFNPFESLLNNGFDKAVKSAMKK